MDGGVVDVLTSHTLYTKDYAQPSASGRGRAKRAHQRKTTLPVCFFTYYLITKLNKGPTGGISRAHSAVVLTVLDCLNNISLNSLRLFKLK